MKKLVPTFCTPSRSFEVDRSRLFRVLNSFIPTMFHLERVRIVCKKSNTHQRRPEQDRWNRQHSDVTSIRYLSTFQTQISVENLSLLVDIDCYKWRPFPKLSSYHPSSVWFMNFCTPTSQSNPFHNVIISREISSSFKTNGWFWILVTYRE